MENLKIRCRLCGKEISGQLGKYVSCGCPNMATVKGDKISAVDLGEIIMVNSGYEKNKSEFLTNEDRLWQENRRKRNVRKLNFEVR